MENKKLEIVQPKSKAHAFWAVVFLAVGLFVTVVVLSLLAQYNDSGVDPATGLPTKNYLKITNNTSKNPLKVSLQLSNLSKDIWVKNGGNGTLGDPIYDDFSQNPPSYQLAYIPQGGNIYLQLRSTGPWRITALNDTDPSVFPVLVECGKDIVCDQSCVDGINYKMKMELSTGSTPLSIIDLIGNPCSGPGGCNNPYKDGLFLPGKAWNDPTPCFAGTCELTGTSLTWADIIHTGQCANSTSTWQKGQRAAACEATKSFTTYSYSHDDTNSSPILVAPYILQLTYSDLS